MSELLTPTELAERWDTSKGRLANMRSAGRGPDFIKIGARVLYRLSDVTAFESESVVRARS